MLAAIGSALAPGGVASSSFGGGQSRGEALDAVGDVFEGRIECSIGPVAHGVRHGPVHPARAGEFFVGGVADGDHEVVRLGHVLQCARPGGAEGEAVPVRGGDRAGLDGVCRVGAGRGCRDVAGVVPEGGGELGAGGVAGADEHHPPHPEPRRRGQPRERVGGEVQVGAAPVGLRPSAHQESGVLELVQVMREQAGRDSQPGLQLDRGDIAQGQ